MQIESVHISPGYVSFSDEYRIGSHMDETMQPNLSGISQSTHWVPGISYCSRLHRTDMKDSNDFFMTCVWKKLMHNCGLCVGSLAPTLCP